MTAFYYNGNESTAIVTDCLRWIRWYALRKYLDDGSFEITCVLYTLNK